MSIKQLAAKFAMPERTVYYNIANNKNIRTQKQGRSKFANVADFAKVCGKDLQLLQGVAGNSLKDQSESSIATSQIELQKLQSKYEIEKESNTRLQKVNTTLQKQLNDYALAFTEEKNEKKELMNKYDELQNKYHQKIEDFAKKYYLVLGVCLVLGGILLFQLIPNLFKY